MNDTSCACNFLALDSPQFCHSIYLTRVYKTFKNCDILDMTFACVGAVDALHNSLDWVKQDSSRKAVVIASDLSKYDINSTGEYNEK